MSVLGYYYKIIEKRVNNTFKVSKSLHKFGHWEMQIIIELYGSDKSWVDKEILRAAANSWQPVIFFFKSEKYLKIIVETRFVLLQS